MKTTRKITEIFRVSRFYFFFAESSTKPWATFLTWFECRDWRWWWIRVRTWEREAFEISALQHWKSRVDICSTFVNIFYWFLDIFFFYLSQRCVGFDCFQTWIKLTATTKRLRHFRPRKLLLFQVRTKKKFWLCALTRAPGLCYLSYFKLLTIYYLIIEIKSGTWSSARSWNADVIRTTIDNRWIWSRETFVDLKQQRDDVE